MGHRAATDEICVKWGMGKSPSSRRRELVRVPACCLLAPKDLACHNLFSIEKRKDCYKALETILIFGYNTFCIIVFTGGYYERLYVGARGVI